MAPPTFVQRTISSPTNIAVIKYWGKREQKLILPINSSVSVTIDQADLATTTTVTASATYDRDRLWLNGEEEDITDNKRVQRVLAEIRARAGDLVDEQSGAMLVKASEWASMRVQIVSINNFPTAAGLASSAAGYAALAFALAKLYGVDKRYDLDEISIIARIGSGSACRSIHGGFVAWDMGKKADGSDSKARLVGPASHWPDLRVLICVVSDSKKAVSSTAGMQTSVDTSPLLAHRAATVVEPRLKSMEAAYPARDFATFAKLSMQDSNQFHATCLDTYPPIFYLTDTSRAIILLCHALNDACGEVVCGYTFDAGPNAVLLTTTKHMPMLAAAVSHFFPPPSETASTYINKPEMRAAAREAKLPEALLTNFKLVPQRGAVKYLYVTGIGPGAHLLPPSASLADAQGMPIYTKAEANAPMKPKPSLQASVALGTAVAVAVVAAIVAMRSR